MPDNFHLATDTLALPTLSLRAQMQANASSSSSPPTFITPTRVRPTPRRQ